MIGVDDEPSRAISASLGGAYRVKHIAVGRSVETGVFAAGEMLDWEAPTGGYLLQASFATGSAAGRGALAWLNSR